MKFHEQLKAYRLNLDIQQKEIARRLNVDPSLISRYEDGRRNIVVDRLPEIQQAYNIPDELLLEMIIQSDAKQLRLQPEQAKELQSHYNDSLYSAHKNLLYSDAFRYLFVSLTSLPDGIRNDFIKKMTKEIESLKTKYPSKDHN